VNLSVRLGAFWIGFFVETLRLSSWLVLRWNSEPSSYKELEVTRQHI
jgi:hypothetical protein